MRQLHHAVATAVSLLGLAATTHAATVHVQVDGLPAAVGSVSCGLFLADAGFPDDERQARTQRQPADPSGTRCRFDDVPAGRVAVAVSHDRNGNGRLDKNFLGIPREPWGVSNGVRPALRAPRFAEAAFEVPADGVLELRIAVAE
jgi:uncharacterized protein (DUF2141 family)